MLHYERLESLVKETQMKVGMHNCDCLEQNNCVGHKSPHHLSLWDWVSLVKTRWCTHCCTACTVHCTQCTVYYDQVVDYNAWSRCQTWGRIIFTSVANKKKECGICRNSNVNVMSFDSLYDLICFLYQSFNHLIL